MAAEVRIEHHYPRALVFVQQHGPETVAVLHDLLAHADSRAGELVVEASVRQIAERLRFLSKDSVHRRLRALLLAGVIRRLPSRSTSTFSPPAYAVDLTGTGITLSTPADLPSA